MAETVKLTKGDRNLVKQIIELGGKDILKCLQCGKCTAACPSASVDAAYRFRKLTHMAELGLRERVIEDPYPWGCTLCNRCTEFCPKKVNTASLILALRRFQATELAIPMLTLDGLMGIMKTGHGIISEEGKKLRTRLGLPEDPPSAMTDPKALEEVKKILTRTRLVEMGLISGE